MKPKTNKAKRFGRRYPWDRWLARDTFTLHQGVDYDCRSYAMALMVHQRVAQRKLGRAEVLVAPDERSVTVTIHRNGGSGAES